jgi:hypothetical protein
MCFWASAHNSVIRASKPPGSSCVPRRFHPAVEHAEVDHGLQLLGDDRCHWIYLNLRGRHGQQCWVVQHAGVRYQGITESNIYLEGNASVSRPRQKSDTNALVFLILFDLLGADGLNREI